MNKEYPMNTGIWPLLTLYMLTACTEQSGPSSLPVAGETQEGGQAMTKSEFGRLPDGRPVHLFTLENSDGAAVRIMEIGASILELRVPDRNGELDDIVLGFDTLEPYLDPGPYFGAVVGRYGNRIAGGKFSIDGNPQELVVNEGSNSLHGGPVGFDKRLWRGEAIDTGDGIGIRFSMTSPDNDQGFPGELTASVTYVWTPDRRLIIDYAAETDAPTVVNLTQHSYFNLDGHDSGSILDHVLELNADAFTPVDEALIPTGEIRDVRDTPFDFRTAKKIGRDIAVDNDQLDIAGGYDHNFVLGRDFVPGRMRQVARLISETSGRTLVIETDQPGVQFYSGNFLDGTLRGKEGTVYEHRSGLCLETQHFPDSPNRPEFPTTLLAPGERYKTRTVFEFGTLSD
jgi:aldose 1-epimerase